MVDGEPALRRRLAAARVPHAPREGHCFGYRQIVVRDGKGAKDRVTMLPGSVIEPLVRHLRATKELHERDTREGYGDVGLPHALARKYPKAE